MNKSVASVLALLFPERVSEEEVIDDSHDQFEYEEVPVEEDFVPPGKFATCVITMQ